MKGGGDIDRSPRVRPGSWIGRTVEVMVKTFEVLADAARFGDTLEPCVAGRAVETGRRVQALRDIAHGVKLEKWRRGAGASEKRPTCATSRTRTAGAKRSAAAKRIATKNTNMYFGTTGT